mmetsp:Transcript_23223/g.69121  ORF Transcript_23223/g.69121 Transcript_23223/m.69121 type:complete len:342 (-) Transcript_23223:112-1137(-)
MGLGLPGAGLGSLCHAPFSRLDSGVGPRRKPRRVRLGQVGGRGGGSCGGLDPRLVLLVRAHQLVPKHDVLRKVGVWLAVVRLVRAHGVLDATEAQLHVVPGVVEAGAEGLDSEVGEHGRDVQPRRVRNHMDSNPVQAERGDLLDRVLVGGVDVAARWKRVAVVVLVHPAIHRLQVHGAVQRRVEHVVDHEQHPKREWPVEQREAGGRSHDERREPQQVRDLQRKYVLHRRVHDQVRHVGGVDLVLEDRLGSDAGWQRRKPRRERPHETVHEAEQRHANCQIPRDPQRKAQRPRVEQAAEGCARAQHQAVRDRRREGRGRVQHERLQRFSHRYPRHPQPPHS